MQTEEFDGTPVRRIVTALIVSKGVLTKLAPRWQQLGKEPFHVKWANEVANWCVDFYAKHKEPPSASIKSFFAKYRTKNKDEETIKTMSRFLSSLSSDYEEMSTDIVPSHLLEIAISHFNDVRLERMTEAIAKAVKRGDSAEAIELARAYREIKLAPPTYIDLFRDKEAQARALLQRQKPLVRYAGGIGEFFGDELS